MTKRDQLFPLVADNKPIRYPVEEMLLYKNSDLISNVKKGYVDPPYVTGIVQQEPVASNKGNEQKSFDPAKQARREAKADVKRKRQAMAHQDAVVPYSSLSKATMANNSVHSSEARRYQRVLPMVPTAELSTKPMAGTTGLSRYAQNLYQEDYILAEVPEPYREPQNPSTKEVKKNDYEFLKKSRVYNHDVNQQVDRSLPQELNISRFD